MNTKKDFEADIAVSLGGYLAEKMIFGDVTTGPSNDLQVSTRIARDMVVKYGMSEKVGVLALEGGNSTLAGSGDGVEKSNYSAKTAELVDEEVRRIMQEGFKTAKKILTKHEDALHNISEVLKDKEVLERDDYEALLKDNKIKIQTKEDRNKLFKIKKNKKA
jgi:cell division protease FtsH